MVLDPDIEGATSFEK